MAVNKLTDAKCRQLKPQEKAVKAFDGGGLYLFISPKGAKTWRLSYRLNGKPQTISFGPYPEVSLAEARQKRDETKAKLRDGADPMAPRRKVPEFTFSKAIETYWAGRKDLSESYRSNAIRGLEMHLEPGLGPKNLGSITRDDLLTELRRLDAKGKHAYVRKVRMWASQVWDWAVENGYAQVNVAALIKPKAFGSAPVEHFPALELSEVTEFMARLSLEGELQSVLACKLLALTWVRTSELRQAQWDEITGNLWRLPAGRMKRRKDHLVPLSPSALAILDQMRLRSSGRYVFPADHRQDRPMSENSILFLLHRIGYKGRMSGHGWRSIASTWANENGYSPDAIERQLAHSPENKVRSAYNRAEYMEERRKMLEDWAKWLMPE